MLENGTKLQLGPLTFTHQVQKINIQERKGVKVLEATRSKKNFVVDSGDSAAKAQIRFLFVGLDEINGILEPDTYTVIGLPSSFNRKLLLIDQEIARTNKNALYKDPTGNNPVDPFVLAANRKFQSAVNRAGADSAEAQLLKEERDNAIRGVVSGLTETRDALASQLESQRAVQTANALSDNLSSGYRIPIGLRSLIALFKCCPIVTLNNQYISSSWKKADKIYDKQNHDQQQHRTQDEHKIERIGIVCLPVHDKRFTCMIMAAR